MDKGTARLVREALVREIRDAVRWSTVLEAWEALLSVRRKEEKMEYYEKCPSSGETEIPKEND